MGAIARRSGGGDGPPRRRLGGQPERREEPPHRVGLGHRAEDPPRAAAAGTNQDLDREHPAEEPGPRPAAWAGRRRRQPSGVWTPGGPGSIRVPSCCISEATECREGSMPSVAPDGRTALQRSARGGWVNPGRPLSRSGSALARTRSALGRWGLAHAPSAFTPRLEQGAPSDDASDGPSR